MKVIAETLSVSISTLTVGPRTGKPWREPQAILQNVA